MVQKQRRQQARRKQKEAELLAVAVFKLPVVSADPPLPPCAHCGVVSPDAFACPACGTVYYCSEEHQHDAWWVQGFSLFINFVLFLIRHFICHGYTVIAINKILHHRFINLAGRNTKSRAKLLFELLLLQQFPKLQPNPRSMLTVLQRVLLLHPWRPPTI